MKWIVDTVLGRRVRESPLLSRNAPEKLKRFAERVSVREVMLRPLVSMRRRFVYFPISKVANSSIKIALREQDAAQCGVDIASPHERLNAPLVTPWQVSEDYYVREVLEGSYFRFAFVRNPFARLLSCYLDRIVGRSKSTPRRDASALLGVPPGESIGFESFLRGICNQKSADMNDHWRDQYSCLQCGEIELHFIGRFENLAADFAEVAARIALPGETPIALTRNTSPQQTSAAARILEFYTEPLADLVRKRFEKDFEAYGYSMALQDVGLVGGAGGPPSVGRATAAGFDRGGIRGSG